MSALRFVRTEQVDVPVPDLDVVARKCPVCSGPVAPRRSGGWGCGLDRRYRYVCHAVWTNDDGTDGTRVETRQVGKQNGAQG